MSDFNYHTLCENVESAIRDRILDGTFGQGFKLVENNLAQEFGISRGPVREALRKLESEHLVEYTRNVGCVVRSVSLKDVYEAYYLRANYEMMALRQAEGRFTDEELAFLELLVNSTPQEKTYRKDIIELDNAFHNVIIRKSRLPFLKQNWEILGYGNYLMVQIKDRVPAEKMEEIRARHRKLFEILRKQDAELSCKAVFEHYMYNMEQEFDKEGLDKTGYYFHL